MSKDPVADILGLFEKGAQKLQQFYDEDKPVYLFSVSVDSIRPQRDDIDQSRLKRGTAELTLRERSGISKVKAIVEFRGNTVFLTRSEGACDLGELAKRLDLEYAKKYRKESLKLDKVLKGGRTHYYTVTNPGHFLDFLHLIHTMKRLDIFSQQGEHAIPRFVKWVAERQRERRKHSTER